MEDEGNDLPEMYRDWEPKPGLEPWSPGQRGFLQLLRRPRVAKEAAGAGRSGGREEEEQLGVRPAAPAPRAPSGPSPSLRTVLPPAPPPAGRGCRPPRPHGNARPGPAALASLPPRSPSGPKPSPAGSPEASAARGPSQHPRGPRPGLERQHSYYLCQHLVWLLGSS